MKEILKFKNLLFLSIFILLSSCGQTIDADDERKYFINLSSLGGITSYKGIPYTGEVVKYVDDEKTQLEWKKNYKEGKLDGLSEEYNKNGQLEESVTYKEGEEEEEVKYTYYENGQLKEKETYKDGKKDGQWEEYGDNGQLWSKATYKDGKPDGQWEEYIITYKADNTLQSSGKLRYKGTYKDGKENGQWEEYDDNGQLFSKGTYKDGKEDGQWEYYYGNDGQLSSKGTYKDGKQDGQWEEYDENGKLMENESGMYKDGVKQDD
mgnify:CR=1 FL=1|tara:strand:+ start:237 stop:1028 length:792 start_codon:yes stop_codon:yes gene_type:complete